MSEPTVDRLFAIEQADVALGVAGLPENDIFRKELREARADLAYLIEAAKRTEAAIMAWRMSGKPDLGELNAAHGHLIVALARVGGA